MAAGAVRALVLTLIVLLLVAGAALGAYVLASGLSDDDDNGGKASGGTVVPLDGIGAYDPPPGDNSEHDDEAPNATDGNPATYWKTETYRTFFKDGVGLVLDAGARRKVAGSPCTTDTPGYLAEIQAGASPTGPFTTVASVRRVADTTAFTLDERGRALLRRLDHRPRRPGRRARQRGARARLTSGAPRTVTESVTA